MSFYGLLYKQINLSKQPGTINQTKCKEILQRFNMKQICFLLFLYLIQRPALSFLYQFSSKMSRFLIVLNGLNLSSYYRTNSPGTN